MRRRTVVGRRSRTWRRPRGWRPRRCPGRSRGPSGSTTARASTCSRTPSGWATCRTRLPRRWSPGRTRTIALVVPDITNPYFFGVIKGAERAAAEAGLTLVLGNTSESAVAEAQVIRRLERAVDGFVISASRLTDDDLRAVAERSPVTLVNRATPGLGCVVADFDSGTRQIVDHLASYGHRAFVFAGGPAESWSGARRWHGLQVAAEERGLAAQRFGPYLPTPASGPAAADAVLASGATAVVCHNDMLALGLMRRLAERGCAVPGDVSVVGFDNVFGADFCHPTPDDPGGTDRGRRRSGRRVPGAQQPAGLRRRADAGAADPPRGPRLDRSREGALTALERAPNRVPAAAGTCHDLGAPLHPVTMRGHREIEGHIVRGRAQRGRAAPQGRHPATATHHPADRDRAQRPGRGADLGVRDRLQEARGQHQRRLHRRSSSATTGRSR